MRAVLLDDTCSVVRSVERVHEDERNVGLVLLVKVLNLANREVEEGHAVTDFNDRLGTDAAHGCAETTVELENGELVEEGRVYIVPDLVGADLLCLGRVNLLPVAGVSVSCHEIAYIFSPFAFSVK